MNTLRIIIGVLFLIIFISGSVYGQDGQPDDVVDVTTPTSPVNVRQYDITDIITPSGLLIDDIDLKTDDGQASLYITDGSIILNDGGEPLQYIEFQEIDESPAPLPGTDIGSSILYVGPERTTFDPPATLVIVYNRNSLPEGVSGENLTIIHFSEENRQWLDIESSVVDAGKQRLTAKIDHSATFAICATSSSSIPFKLWFIPLIVLWLIIMFRFLAYLNSRGQNK